MDSYYECPKCGKMTLHVWQEKHEFWGAICYEEMAECENENCGEPTCDDCGEYGDLVDGLCEDCQVEHE